MSHRLPLLALLAALLCAACAGDIVGAGGGADPAAVMDEVSVGDTVELLSRLQGRLSFEVTAVESREIRGHSVRVGYDEIIWLSVRRLDGGRTGLLRAVASLTALLSGLLISVIQPLIDYSVPLP